MQTRSQGVFSVTWVPKLFLPPVKIRIFGPKWPFLPQNMLSWAHIGHAISFGALLVGWLVVVARGLYLARHLFTLYKLLFRITFCKWLLRATCLQSWQIAILDIFFFKIVEHVFFKLSLWTFSSSDQANYRLSQKSFLKNSFIIGLKSALIKKVFEKN